MFGGLSDKAFGFYGPLRFANKQLAGDLRIMTWAHFVPSYDQWLDNTYIKQWGEANDVEVKVDHINNAFLNSTGASEVAAQSGHDLFWFISPPAAFQKQAIPVTDLVQEVTKKLGPLSRVARKATYNPKTKQFYGFPETYAPDPVQYRKSFFEETGVSLQHVGGRSQGSPEAQGDRAPGRSRDVERDRLEHAPHVAPVLLRRLHPERGEPNRHRTGGQQEGRHRSAQDDARHLSERHVRRGLRLDRRLEQPGLPRGPPLDGPERDLRSSARPSSPGIRRCPTTPGSPPSRAAPICGSATNT